MNNIDTIFNILQYFNGTEIIIYSTINKTFYLVANNNFIWFQKLNNDFCHNGVFSLPTSKQINYKELYKKYYRLHVISFYKYKHVCIDDIIIPYLPIPKLSSKTNFVTKCHNTHRHRDPNIMCQFSNYNYIGIGNVKLLLFTKYPFESSAMNFIKEIRLHSEGLTMSWHKVGLIIMQKLNKIKISETFYEVDKLWCYELKIQFNATENWLRTWNYKIITIEVDFVKDHLFDDVCFKIDHIILDSEQDSFVKMFTDSVFSYCIVKFFLIDFIKISQSYYDIIIATIRIQQFPMGIFIFLMDENMERSLPYKFEFHNIIVTMNNKIVEIQYSEILTLEENIYFVPMALDEIREQNLVNTKICCRNIVKTIEIRINKMNWNKNNLSITSAQLCFLPLCYYYRMINHGNDFYSE